MDARIEKLLLYVKKLGSAVVAYSGGSDSSLLALLTYKALGKDAVLATVESPLTTAEEIKESKEIARSIGIEQYILYSDILSLPEFRENPKHRCYICKKEMFSSICRLKKELGFSSVIEGSNADDILTFRPGLDALKKLDIKSPFLEAGLNKQMIRAYAKALGLSNHDLPSSACLASRIPYGQKITSKKLAKIKDAEYFLKKLGYKVVRVRYHYPVARIEVKKDKIEKTLGDSNEIISYFKRLGFSYITIDLEGFRSGSLDEEV